MHTHLSLALVLLFIGVLLGVVFVSQNYSRVWSGDGISAPIACPMDAKLCPDGSAVGRSGPNCSFPECPSVSQEVESSIVCADAMKQVEACTLEYAPVCGKVAVECVTVPCDPVLQTFGDACAACANGNAISYTPGECEEI